MKKKRWIAVCIVLILSTLLGCAKKETTLEDILPRLTITKVMASYLNVGVGDNMPAVAGNVTQESVIQVLDVIYGAKEVTVDIPKYYSPELSASHEITLETEKGVMNIYFDDYQNILSIPFARKDKDVTVRTYLSYQPTGLNEILTVNQSVLPTATPVPTPANTPSLGFNFPPDDSGLRAAITPEMLAAAGVPLLFEPGVYQREADAPLYYAFGYNEKPELPENKVLLVAIPQTGEAEQVVIDNVSEREFCITVQVSLARMADGGTPLDCAVIMERSDIDKQKPIVFVDTAGQILYVQMLEIPGTSTELIDPAAGQQPDPTATPAP